MFSLFHYLHTINHVHIVEYSNYSNKRHIWSCGAYWRGSTYQRDYYYYCFYLYHESGFQSHIYIQVNRLFTPVKKFKYKRDMPKQSAITCTKSTKKTQEEAVKQAQSQQYRHQSDIIDIPLLPPPSTPYLCHTPLQSPHFDSKQTNADIVGISQHLKSNIIYVP